MPSQRADVLIIGAGPAGLVLACELGRRGVSCILLDQNAGPPTFPKANSTTSRTMEHYRRLGLAHDIRAIGLPDDYTPDISYHTRYAAHELARMRWPSRTQALAARQTPDPRWPTPEPMHRGQQMLIEPILRRHLERWPAVDRRFGWQVQTVEETAAGVRVRAIDPASGRSEAFDGDYAVGCDGARSLVRDAIGANYGGIGSEDREFMGGKMLATYLDAPQFYTFTPRRRSWQYWAVNRKRFGALVAIDGEGRFVLHTQLPRGEAKSLTYAKESIELTTGRAFDYDILGIAEWTAGFTLVADCYGSRRMFIAGDAAHLFTPTAGLGYNTSVDDVSNLGWKLAAVCRGWGGPHLLASYQVERKPIAQRNTAFARSIAEYFRSIKMPQALEENSPEGAAARGELGAGLRELGEREFNVPGIIFGAFYSGSSIIANEAGDLPADDPSLYVPHARPGARAPHVWVNDGVALYDQFGRDFTLLRLSADHDTVALQEAAKTRGVPLAVCDCANEEARDLYRADLVLIRPDQHVAWRGNAPPPDPDALIRLVVGFGYGSPVATSAGAA